MTSFLLWQSPLNSFEQIYEVTDGDGDHCEQPALSCSCIKGLMELVSARDKLGCLAPCI